MLTIRSEVRYEGLPYFHDSLRCVTIRGGLDFKLYSEKVVHKVRCYDREFSSQVTISVAPRMFDKPQFYTKDVCTCR